MADTGDGDHGEAGAASGVDALIRRLREQGVAAGRDEAEKLVHEAEQRAQWVIRQAEEEAEQIRAAARRDAEALRRSGEEALHVAARDAVLEMHDTLTHRFASQVEWMIGEELSRADFLRELVVQLVARAREGAPVEREKRVDVLLPEDIVGLEDLRRDPEELSKGNLTAFVAAVAGDVLREGVEFHVDPELEAGLRVRLVDHNMEIDLSKRAVAAVLLRHLQPRFRALLEGILK